MELFYVHPENVSEMELRPDDFERKHIVSTLRKGVGDAVHFTDGQGNLYTGKISQTVPKLIVEIYQKEKKPKPAVEMVLACGFIKQNRMDFILEKGTELGVNRFLFFRSRYATYFSANTGRLQKVVRQALKQSLRFYLPEISVFPGLDDFFAFQPLAETRLLAVDSEQPLLRNVMQLEKIKLEHSVIIAIGPEGGFSAQELQQFSDNGFMGFSLGGHRLRTETAALASIAIVSQYIH